VSFEPSPEAYRRLVANMAANHARHVTPYQAAIGETSGLQAFYEPVGHLTNGSLLREFSHIFSNTVDETVAVVLAAPELGRWLGVEGRTLIEIDVEGFEPELLTALGPLLERHRPGMLVEVLPFTLDALNANPVLAAYDRHLRTPAGLEQSAAFHACSIVMVGEAATDASGVISTVEYALGGLYDSGFTTTLPGTSTATNKSHNLGVLPRVKDVIFECITADNDYVVGDQISVYSTVGSESGNIRAQSFSTTRNGMRLATTTSSAFIAISPASFNVAILTAARWKYKFIAERGW